MRTSALFGTKICVHLEPTNKNSFNVANIKLI